MGKKRARGRPGRPRKRVFRGNQFSRRAEGSYEDTSSNETESSSSSDESVGLRTVTKLVALENQGASCSEYRSEYPNFDSGRLR